MSKYIMLDDSGAMMVNTGKLVKINDGKEAINTGGWSIMPMINGWLVD